MTATVSSGRTEIVTAARTAGPKVIHNLVGQHGAARFGRNRGRVSAYRLYAMESLRLLSVHDGYEDALAAADEHTLAALATANDWVTVETCIVGPGLRGPLTVHPVVTHVGPPDDLESARRWLQDVRCRIRGKWF